MTHFHLRLEEGMNRFLQYHPSFCLWVTPGLPIDIEFFVNKENVSNIYVAKNFARSKCKYILGAIIDINKIGFLEEIDEFSDLRELKNRYPHLFDVYGVLYTFP